MTLCFYAYICIFEKTPMDKNQLKQLLRNNNYETATPYVDVHEERYLDMVTEADPQVTIRLVFRARQLPCSRTFAQMMAPLRSNHIIDTFMIPNENMAVDSDSDVILGFLGTLDRVCRALHDFLLDFAPARCRFYIWKLCVLTPSEAQCYIVGGYDPSLVYRPQDGWCESSIPELYRVLGRHYGPVYRDAEKDDHIFTIQSSSLASIMEAIRYVGETIILQEAVSGPQSGGFYMGGSPSVIPQALNAYAGIFSAAANKFEYGLPVGYLVRPEMLQSWNWMLLRPFHLQVKMSSLQAVYLMSSERLFRLRSRYNSGIEISHNRVSKDRVCNIGAHNHQDIAKTVAALVEVLEHARGWDLHLGSEQGQVRVIVPQRVADALDQDETQVMIEEDALGRRIPVRPPPERLEAREVEFTAVVKGLGSLKRIEDGIHSILAFMYMRE